MKKMSLAFTIALVFVFIGHTASEVVYTSDGMSPTLNVLHSTENGITFEFHCPEVSVTESFVDGFGPGYEFQITDRHSVLPTIGAPSIQSYECMVQIPEKGTVSVEYQEADPTLLGQYTVIPFQRLSPIGSGYTYPYEINQQIYSENALFPKTITSPVSCQILRDIRIAFVRIHPIQYNPITKEVYLVKKVKICLRFTHNRGDNELSIVDKSLTPSFLPLYNDVLNFNPSNLRTTVPKVGCYLFLGNQANLDAVKDLINWKIQKGYDVKCGVVGSDSIPMTTDGIDKWIEKVYSSWPNKPEYLLLVGNEKVIPPKMITDKLVPSTASDHVFGTIGTSTKIPSIHVGRITGDKAGSTDDPTVLKYIAWKIMMHEKQPFEGEWLTKAETWGCNAQSGTTISKAWAAFMKKGVANVVESVEGTNATTVATHMSQGLTTFGYVGHGNPTSWSSLQFSLTQVKTLTNNRMQPWIFSLACNVAAFVGKYCLCENLMSEGTIEKPQGAIGMFGLSVESQENIGTITKGMNSRALKAVFEEKVWRMGPAFTVGKADAVEDQDREGAIMWGCPEIEFYTVNPLQTLKVEHPTTNAPAFEVKVSASSGVLSNALVGITTNKNILLASGFTNTNGVVNATLPTLPSGTDSIYVTVTYHNSKPYLGAFAVSATGLSPDVVSGAGLVSATVLSNGFVRNTQIHYVSSRRGTIDLKVFDIHGSEVFASQIPVQSSGKQVYIWDNKRTTGTTVANGYYIVRLTQGITTITRHLFLAQ